MKFWQINNTRNAFPRSSFRFFTSFLNKIKGTELMFNTKA